MPLKAHENLHWENADAEKAIEEGGSKAGAYHFLKENCPELRPHLPRNTSYLAPGDDMDAFLAKLKFGKRPKIIRGCHPLDFTGMVDVIDSIPDLENIYQIRNAISQILKDAQRKEVRSYMEYEAPGEYDGNIGILVQNYYKGAPRSIIEHPNQPGIYRNERLNTGFSGGVEVVTCDAEGQSLGHDSMSPNVSRDVLDLYRKVGESGLIPRGYSFQMEYGYGERGTPIVYQVRLFQKKIPAMRDFDPGDVKEETIKHETFGVTPEKGILLPLARLDKKGVERMEKEAAVAYFRNTAEETLRLKHGDHRRELGLMPRNIKAYIPTEKALLEHDHFRWMQKADVTIRFDIKRLGRIRAAAEKDSIRFYSNGIYGWADFER